MLKPFRSVRLGTHKLVELKPYCSNRNAKFLIVLELEVHSNCYMLIVLRSLETLQLLLVLQ